MTAEATFTSVYDGRMAAFVDARLTCDERARPVDVQPDWTGTPGTGPDAQYMLVGDARRTLARVHPLAAAHIVRYSPGRAARQVAAHRRILARFNRACAQLAVVEEPLITLPGSRRAELLERRRDYAVALADVACVWAEHPQFLSEWAHFAALDDNAPVKPIPAPEAGQRKAPVGGFVVADPGGLWHLPQQHRPMVTYAVD